MKAVRKIKKETWAEILFLLFLFCFYFMWARIQPLNASPDEQMRYRIAQYIYEHGSIPRGDDPAVRDAVWGISYAFFPVLDYMIAAVFMRVMSLVSTAPFALLLAARTVNVLCGVGMAFFVLRIGRKVFFDRKAWVLAVFVALLPEAAFVFSYVNTDALALFAASMIVYGWVLGVQDGWSYKNCALLAVGIGVCGLSYYNAYGFILCSIVLFGTTLLIEAKEKKDYRIFLYRGSFVCVIVLAIVGWWFIRNILIYDGDILGRTASTLSSEKYAIEGFKPSDRPLPSDAGMTFWEMLTQGFGGTTMSWMELVSRGFVGRFGRLDVCMPSWVENNYMDFIKAGFLLVFLHPVRTFAIKDKNGFRKIGIFHWCMLAAVIIPNIINAYYSYFSDYQPQGRYSLPMLIPLAYFVITGYGNVFDVLVENEKIRKAVYTVICILLAVLVIYVYLTVFWPEYRDLPFSLRNFISG